MNSSQEPLGQFQLNLGTPHAWGWRFK